MIKTELSTCILKLLKLPLYTGMRVALIRSSDHMLKHFSISSIGRLLHHWGESSRGVSMMRGPLDQHLLTLLSIFSHHQERAGPTENIERLSLMLKKTIRDRVSVTAVDPLFLQHCFDLFYKYADHDVTLKTKSGNQKPNKNHVPPLC